MSLGPLYSDIAMQGCACARAERHAAARGPSRRGRMPPMIVRRTGGRIQLITQPDHAQLAGRIMARCAALADRPRRTSILLAVAEHDNGWAEEDAAPEAGEDGTV